LHIQECAKQAMDGLQLAVARETEFVYTQNTHYLDAYKTKYLAHYRDARTRNVPSPPPPPSTPRPHVSIAPYFHGYEDECPCEESETAPSSSVGDVLNLLRRYDSAYANVTASDLPKLLPGDGMEPAIDIMAEVRAYFQCAVFVFS